MAYNICLSLAYLITKHNTIKVHANGRISPFLMAEEYSTVHIYICHIFIHSSTDRHLACVLAMVSNAAMG